MQIQKSIRLLRAVVVTGLLLSTLTVALAQAEQQTPATATSPQQPSTAAPEPSPVSVASPTRTPRVVAVEGDVELDNIVHIQIDGLVEWAENNEPLKLVPYINGRAIKGNYPEELHLDHGRLTYHLEITPANKAVWVDLLGAPPGIRRLVTLSVGLEDGSAFDSVHERGRELPLTIISPVYGIVALLVIIATLVMLIWLVRNTNIIREPGPPPTPGKRRPYNLGRAQMAFWFFLIYASYITIWLVTDALDTITPSLLALMGISAGTALGEAMIDSSKETSKTNQMQDLQAEKQAVEQGISQSQTDLSVIDAATATVSDQANRDVLNQQLVNSRTRLGQIEQQIRTLTSQQSATISSGFLRDVLSDSSGYSFHRFQIFAWTIVLGIIFLSSVYNNLTMPEFSTTLLGLMGLSAGTYIGFKFPEQK
jgi:hypothetical protein